MRGTAHWERWRGAPPERKCSESVRNLPYWKWPFVMSFPVKMVISMIMLNFQRVPRDLMKLVAIKIGKTTNL